MKKQTKDSMTIVLINSFCIGNNIVKKFEDKQFYCIRENYTLK